MVPRCSSQFARYPAWHPTQCRADSSSGCGDWPGADATAGSVATTNTGNEKDTCQHHYVHPTTFVSLRRPSLHVSAVAAR